MLCSHNAATTSACEQCVREVLNFILASIAIEEFDSPSPRHASFSRQQACRDVDLSSIRDVYAKRAQDNACESFVVNQVRVRSPEKHLNACVEAMKFLQENAHLYTSEMLIEMVESLGCSGVKTVTEVSAEAMRALLTLLLQNGDIEDENKDFEASNNSSAEALAASMLHAYTRRLNVDVDTRALLETYCKRSELLLHNVTNSNEELGARGYSGIRKTLLQINHVYAALSISPRLVHSGFSHSPKCRKISWRMLKRQTITLVCFVMKYHFVFTFCFALQLAMSTCCAPDATFAHVEHTTAIITDVYSARAVILIR